MKLITRLFLASALLAPVALLGAAFEGKITMKMTPGRGEPQEMSYNIKGDKMRIEIATKKGGMGGMIMDGEKKEMIMMMDDQKMYMTMAIPDVAAEAAGKKGEDVKFEKTNETEKILGYTATKYIATQKDGTKTEMWLAEGLGKFMSASPGNPMTGRRAAPPEWERALAGKELFPLRVVGKDKGEKQTFQMDVIAIDKKSLPDSMFTPPASYQKFDMGGMMKGMIPGFGK